MPTSPTCGRPSKTELVAINLIARGLALNPRARFLHISYSDDWEFIEIPALITDEYVAKLPEHIRDRVECDERDADGRYSYWPYKEPLQELLASEKADAYVFSALRLSWSLRMGPIERPRLFIKVIPSTPASRATAIVIVGCRHENFSPGGSTQQAFSGIKMMRHSIAIEGLGR